MRWLFGLTIYRVLLPVLMLVAFPGWLVKMAQRGGLRSRLWERLGFYLEESEYEPCGAVHIHAVSVGETQLALKLIRQWRHVAAEQRFVVATGTATGHALAMGADIEGVRVTYAPVDFRGCVRRYLDRFEPEMIVLVEGEVWPHLVLECERRGVALHLVNARFSPRSARRFEQLATWVSPMFGRLSSVCIQDVEDERLWRVLGVSADRIHSTGSLKYDPVGSVLPARRDEFGGILDSFGRGRVVVIASSTHAGEESWIARAIREAAPDALPVIVPRHAERREQVVADLSGAGFTPVLRSRYVGESSSGDALVVDSTGELRDWTAHADLVIVGKSFLARGGQNPCEAIQARKPVIVGPHMENFQPLTRRLVEAGGVLEAFDEADLSRSIRRALDCENADRLVERAASVLESHAGATERVVRLLLPHPNSNDDCA